MFSTSRKSLAIWPILFCHIFIIKHNFIISVQARGMGTLKDVAMQLKSITNIQKITSSMKMVSSAKFARAERELRLAIPYGIGAAAFYEKSGIIEHQKESQGPVKNHLVIAITSDRGLCGAANSTIGKVVLSFFDLFFPPISNWLNFVLFVLTDPEGYAL